MNDVTLMPCTCGELFQGSLDGEPCLISCPIDIYSSARVTHDGQRLAGRKVLQALESLHLPTWAGIMVQNPLPAARGYGTSTADIGAALYAMSAALKQDFNSAQIASLAVAVEPSDSTLFCGLSLFAHRSGAFHKLLGPAPQMKILVLDPGGWVDSDTFNALDWRAHLARLSKDHRRAFEMLCQGIEAKQLEAIGEACTLSALLHQTILFNPRLEKGQKLCREIGGLGICRAHSGTLLGLLLDPALGDEQAMLNYSRKQMDQQVDLRIVNMVNGGPVISALDGSLPLMTD